MVGRRILFPALGLAELVGAVAMAGLGYALPGARDVDRTFDGAHRVASASGEQVRILRDQVADLRRARIGPAAEQLRAASRVLADTMKAGRVDFEAVATIRDAAGRAADGLDGLARGVDPEALGRLGDGMGKTADFLDGKVIPSALKEADRLEAASGGLGAVASRFARVVKEAPPDLGPVREVHDGLARFDEGLGSLHATLDPRRLAALRQATEGAEQVVSEAARMADRAAGYSYPVVTFDGIKPRVGTRPFWPRGAEVGAGMRKVAGGVAAMDREIESLAGELPKVQAAVAEGRKSVGATRKALAVALARQEEVERLLAEMPARAARLGEELPRLTSDLAGALRGTEGLAQVALALRESRKGIDAASEGWPATRQGLEGSAALLRATRDHLDGALRGRPRYEEAFGRMEEMSGEFAALLPGLAEGLDARLDREDRTLAEMGAGIEQVDRSLPVFSDAMTRSLVVGRLMAWLVAAVAGAHGACLILANRPRRGGAGDATPA